MTIKKEKPVEEEIIELNYEKELAFLLAQEEQEQSNEQN